MYAWCIISRVVTLIAWKREVATNSLGLESGRFSVERMSSYETGDKSLYPIFFCFDQRGVWNLIKIQDIPKGIISVKNEDTHG